MNEVDFNQFAARICRHAAPDAVALVLFHTAMTMMPGAQQHYPAAGSLISCRSRDTARDQYEMMLIVASTLYI